MALREFEIVALETPEIEIKECADSAPEIEAEEKTRVSFGHSPKPSSDNEDATWLFWDEEQGKYVDSGFLVGVKAGGDTVYSVNGKTKRVVLTASDVGALPDDTKIPDKVSELQNDAGYLTEHQDLSEYAKKDEIPEVPEPVTEETVAGWGFTKNGGTYVKPAGGIPKSDLAAGVIPTVPTKVSAFQNDAGYLKEHQSLADYAKRSEIPAAVTDSHINALIDAKLGEIENGYY